MLSILLALPQLQSPPVRLPVELPDVVIFLLDDVGAADVDLLPTPAIDSLARRGTTFARGYAQPKCAPARVSLYLSEWQGTGGGFACENGDIGPSPETLPSGLSSLPKTMEGIGYHTALFGRWGLGTTPNAQPSGLDYAFAPNQWGFETWRAGVPDGVAACIPDGSYSNWLRVDDGLVSTSVEYHTIALREDFLAWWLTTPSPRFAFVSLQAAHMGGSSDDWHIPPAGALPPGYVPPASPTDREKYEAMVQSADHAIGRMMTVVSLADTFVLVLADNGTPREVPPPGVPSSRVKFSTYEGGVRVPFVAAGLGFPTGRTVRQPVSIVDVLPTLAELTAFAPRHASFDGQSILPALFGERLGREWAYVGNPGNNDRALIQERYKLKIIGSFERIYDLWLDPNENNPILPTAAGYGDILDELRAQMAEAQS